MRFLEERTNSVDRKLLIAAGVLVVFAIAGIVFVARIGIRPTDTKIIDILDENREELLSIGGVMGAGIARDEDNHIVGIAVYVEDEVTEISKIPAKLGEFQVFVRRMGEISEFEKEKMIIHT
ncbi:hypothetical protein [[Eubacterium] cellulosolvens]